MKETKQWNKWFKKCLNCGTTKRAYYAKGKCERCYHVNRYAKSAKVRAIRKKLTYAWKEKHPIKWKRILRKAYLKSKII